MNYLSTRYWFGNAFFKKNYQEGYIEKLTGLNIDDILKIIKKSKNFSDIDYLKIQANSNLFTLDISEKKPFDENTIHIWSNLLFSLEKVFNKKLPKLTVKKWTITTDWNETETYLLDWEIKIIPKIEQNKFKINNKIDNIYKTIKFIRDICAHYDSYSKNFNDKEYYILLSTYIKREYVYLLCIKVDCVNVNKRSLILLQYNINNIKEITDTFIKDIFNIV